MFFLTSTSYNKRQLSRIYPSGTRVGSANYMPQVNKNKACSSIYSRIPLLRTLLGEDVMSVIVRVRNGGVRQKIELFCLQTYEIICHYANVKFPTWPHEPEKKIRPQAGNSRVRPRLKNGFFIFLYRNVALYYTSEDFGRSERKNNWNVAREGHKSVRISVIARVRNNGEGLTLKTSTQQIKPDNFVFSSSC